MKKLLLAATVAAVACALAGTPAEEQLLKDLPGIFERSGAHYKALLEAMKAQPPDTFPKRFQDGKLVVIKPRDWCSGFFPGSLWYLYEYTKDDFWKEQAVAYTERLIEPLRHDASNHDVGFRTYCSAGNGLRLTGDKRYAESAPTARPATACASPATSATPSSCTTRPPRSARASTTTSASSAAGTRPRRAAATSARSTS